MAVETATGRHIPANPDKFEFDGEVASIFNNMALRSLPGYVMAQDMVSRLAAPLLNPGSSVVDIGCSTGNFLRAIRARVEQPETVRFVGVDLSAPMLAEAEAAAPWGDYYQLDLLQWPQSADDLKARLSLGETKVVMVGWTLQFLQSFERRAAIIRAIHDALAPGGMLVITEKYAIPDHTVGPAAQEAYISFRVENGYSEEEIRAKTAALRNAMWPATQDWTRHAMRSAGFGRVEQLYRIWSFGGLVAFKDELP